MIQVTYDDIKSHQKAGFQLLYRKHNFGKAKRKGQIDPPLPPTFLGLRKYKKTKEEIKSTKTYVEYTIKMWLI